MLARNVPLDIALRRTCRERTVRADASDGSAWVTENATASFAEREDAPVHGPIPAIHRISWSPAQGPDGEVEPKRWLRIEDKHAA